MPVFDTIWGSTGAKVLTTVTTVAALAGAITASAAAWPLVEPYLFAHRGYVLQQVGEVRAPVNEILIWKFEDAKNAIRKETADWNVRLAKETDPTTRELMQRRVEQLSRDQEELDNRLRGLRGK